MFKNAHSARLSDILRHLILAWLLAVTIEYLLLPASLWNLGGLTGLAQMSPVRISLITLLGAAALMLLSHFKEIRPAERLGIAGVFTVLAFATLCASFSWAYLTVCIVIAAALAVYCKLGWDCTPEPQAIITPKRSGFLWITVGASVLLFLFVSIWTVCRVYSFSTPSYDFGIFSQMFYNMKHSGLPMTTLERDGLLSHFRVHMSPIYYLMLPFYWLIPTPATLQVLQAAVIVSAVIPLWKLGKLHGLSDPQRTLLCILLLLFPAFSGGTGYDLHENCFLTPLILWLLYGIDKKNTAITPWAALLTLMVKEDAAVYVAIIALWLIVKTCLRPCKDRRDLITGSTLLIVSLIWFLLVTGYLSKVGDGVMTYRYDNFIYDGSSSLLTVIKAVLMNPMKAVYECVDREKLPFIAITLLPLLGLPLLTRRYERYILLIPYVLVNLMSDYQYQHNIFFQYTFGSTACLMYLAAVNLADVTGNAKRLGILSAACVLSAVCFLGTVLPKAVPYPIQCIRYSDYYAQIRDTLSEIPEDASVAATTFYTTQLSNRPVLYDTKYCTQEHLLSCQYIALSHSGDFSPYEQEDQDGMENLTALLLSQGYTIYRQIPDVLTIYVRS